MNNTPLYLERAYLALPESQHHVARSCANAAERALESLDVGRPMRIRMDRNHVVTGKVVSATVHRLHVTPSSVAARFAVVLECGVAKVEKTVYLKTIPTRSI